MAVTYQFYTTTYKSDSIPTGQWDRVELRASEILDHYKDIFEIEAPANKPNAESMAICAIADAFYFFEGMSSGYSSSSIGSVSSSKGQIDTSPRGQSKEYLRCISMYLNVYRGVC